MLGVMIYQCMRGCSCQELDAAGLAGYYTMHSGGVFPCDPNGVPFNAGGIACTGDPIADITEDMAAEQKARATYEHLMNMTCNEQIIEPLLFLREREVVHFQRFGECLDILQNMPEGMCGMRYGGMRDMRGGCGMDGMNGKCDVRSGCGCDKDGCACSMRMR